MALRTELSLRLPNSPGELERICVLLDGARVSVLALHLESSGRLRFVPDNPLEAAETLRDAGLQVDEREVLFTSLTNRVGALVGLTRHLSSAGVNIEYAYATTIEGGPRAGVVIGVEDAKRAASLLGI